MNKAYGIRKSKALRQHWTWNGGAMHPKKQFKTLDDCLGYMEEHRINKDKFHPYVCPDCGMWNIGHSKKRERKWTTTKDRN